MIAEEPQPDVSDVDYERADYESPGDAADYAELRRKKRRPSMPPGSTNMRRPAEALEVPTEDDSADSFAAIPAMHDV